MIEIFLLVLLVLLIAGAFGALPANGRTTSFVPSGLIGLLLVIVLMILILRYV
jgi:hypothetical protein